MLSEFNDVWKGNVKNTKKYSIEFNDILLSINDIFLFDQTRSALSVVVARVGFEPCNDLARLQGDSTTNMILIYRAIVFEILGSVKISKEG